MKKTAVEWLEEIYLQTNNIDNFDLEVAKEMEKQQSYSEEEVLEIIALFVNDAPQNTKQWFEQFKKK